MMAEQLDLFDQLAGEKDSPLRDRFLRYHRKNPHVFDKFCELTLQAIKRGHKNLGAGCITEVMRWMTDIKTEGERYKINNSYRAFYARMFESKYPEYKGFFRKRISEAD